MAFSISLDQPQRGQNIRATGSFPEGYVVDAYEFDAEERRVLLVFLKTDARAAASSFDEGFPIQETGEGVLHTVNALLIVGNRIVASDRKRVRSGRVQG